MDVTEGTIKTIRTTLVSAIFKQFGICFCFQTEKLTQINFIFPNMYIILVVSILIQ